MSLIEWELVLCRRAWYSFHTHGACPSFPNKRPTPAKCDQELHPMVARIRVSNPASPQYPQLDSNKAGLF